MAITYECSDEDRIKGHDRVIAWTMACLVLHQLLIDLREDDSWLEYGIDSTSANVCICSGTVIIAVY